MMPTPKLAFITIVATLAYLGLAILGWGGFAAAWRATDLLCGLRSLSSLDFRA